MTFDFNTLPKPKPGPNQWRFLYRGPGGGAPTKNLRNHQEPYHCLQCTAPKNALVTMCSGAYEKRY
ncbi:hypothetical protein NQ315_012150 [Exocentrus adspersus]|uniref:Uncharacterized protein n=1 Tax=Exocentrus adspersus TaxID=1586481 RepID=A0AAV8VY17_9CUCU|nr:hypothetical protein NQ315_012150 [Exocentrus adspersus]